MRQWMIYIASIAFLSIAVFGIFTIFGSGHAGCFSAAAAQSECPRPASTLVVFSAPLPIFESFSDVQILRTSLFSLREKFNYWLALHENSPSHA